jgi:hypothetical protein
MARKYKPRDDTPAGRENKLWFSSIIMGVPIPEFVEIDGPHWLDYLRTIDAFVYYVGAGDIFFSVKRYPRQRGRGYWTAYKQIAGLTRKFYIGSDDKLTIKELEGIGQAVLFLIDHPEEG